jgi:hypothetical protein
MVNAILLDNAKNLCYFLVEVNSNYILHVEVVDKRHVGLVSTNMEQEGVKKSLQKLQEDLHIVELVTDASSSIKKLLGIKKLLFFLSLGLHISLFCILPKCT